MSNEEFTSKVNSGQISKSEFCRGSRWGMAQSGGLYGYGLAQWTMNGEKDGLYTFAQNYPNYDDAYTNRATPYTDFDIADIYMQLDYTWYDLNRESHFAGALNQLMTATDVDTALSETHKYERWSYDQAYCNIVSVYAHQIIDEYYANN